jgi:hypothetical protein
MTSIKIDSDISPPKANGKYKNKYKLEIGQSIFLAGEKNFYQNGLIARLKKENPEHEYVSRAWGGDGTPFGARIWRLK